VVAIFTAVICLTGILYTIAAFFQLGTMREQLEQIKGGSAQTDRLIIETKKLAEAATDTAKLTRQQLVGTMGAVINISFNLGDDSVSHIPHVEVILFNRGQVSTPDVHANFTVEVTAFPNFDSILNSAEYAIPKQIVPAKDSARRSIPLQQFSFAENGDFVGQKRGITVRGTFGFDNGFGDKIDLGEFCYSYIGRYSIKNADGSTSGGGGFMPCEIFKEYVPFVVKNHIR